MPIDASIPLQFHSDFNPLQSLAAITALQGAQQQRQLNQQRLQLGEQELTSGRIAQEETQRKLAEAEMLRKSYVEAGGVWAKFQQLAASRGASPSTLVALNEQGTKLAKDTAEAEKLKLDNEGTKHSQAAGIIMGAINDPNYEQNYPAYVAKYQPLYPNDPLPQTPPSKDDLQVILSGHLTGKGFIEAEQEKRAKAGETRAVDEEEQKKKLRPFQLTEAQGQAGEATAKETGAELSNAARTYPAGLDKLPKDDAQQAHFDWWKRQPAKVQAEVDAKYSPAVEARVMSMGVPPERAKAGVDYPKPPEVEEQEKRIIRERALARQSGTGLSPAQSSQLNSLARDLDKHPVVKDYTTQVNKYQTIRGILDRNSLGGPGDLALIYEFMKALDPSSVVRESEYASAAKSGNIFAGALARFNGYLKPEGGFLPPEVKKSFLDIVGEKMAVSRGQAAKIFQDYTRRGDVIIGQPGQAKNYFTDYANLYEDTPAAPGGTGQQTPPPASGGAGGLTYYDPQGNPHQFRNQTEADSFRKLVEAAGGNVTTAPPKK